MVEGNSKEEEEVEEPEDLCLGLFEMDFLISLTPDPQNRLFSLYEAAISIKTTTECRDMKCDSKEAEETVEEYNFLWRQFDDVYIQPAEIVGGPPNVVYGKGGIKRVVALGCCDYPCPSRIKLKTESMSGKVLGTTPPRPGRRPNYKSKDFERVRDIIRAEFGLGGKNPPTFKPCCKKKKSTEAGAPGAI